MAPRRKLHPRNRAASCHRMDGTARLQRTVPGAADETWNRARQDRILLAPWANLATAWCRGPWCSRENGGGLGGGIHPRTLLGVHAPERWRNDRVRGRAPALDRVQGG